MAKNLIELNNRDKEPGGGSSNSSQILIYDQIGGFFSGISAKDIAEKIAGFDDGADINVRINSPGGNVFDGVAIYNSLAKHPGKVIIDIDAQALSIASIIAMSGDEIRIAENAWMMVHQPWAVAVGSSEDLRREADLMDKIKGQLVNIYAARTKQTRNSIEDMVDQETWLTADEALSFGFVDSITENKSIAALADLSRFNKVPEAFATRVQHDIEASKRPRTDAFKQKMAAMQNTALKIKAQSGRRTG